jgi:hypothetical protein
MATETVQDHNLSFQNHYREIPTLNADNLGHREVAHNQLRSAPTMQRLPNINILQFSTRHTPASLDSSKSWKDAAPNLKKQPNLAADHETASERAYGNLHPTKLTDYSTTLQCNCGFPATVQSERRT